MLKRIGEEIKPQFSEVKIKNSIYPKPFDIGLEFNAPVHGTWNIVHIGFMMPEAHQVYVCADNCMRGVVMTAAEMNELDRFHSVTLFEKDLLNGSLENETIEGVSDVINKLEERPKVIELFTVCLHHFLGCDLDYVYATLEKRFPDIIFVRCFMDPILQRTSYTPEQKLRKAMLEFIKPLEVKKNIYLLGSDVKIRDCYIFDIASKYGYSVKQIHDMKTFDEYMEIGDGALYIANYPTGLYGVSELANRLNRPFLYLPYETTEEKINEDIILLDYVLSEINENIDHGCKIDISIVDKNNELVDDNVSINKEVLLDEYNVDIVDYIDKSDLITDDIVKLEDKISEVKSILSDTEISVDYTAHPRPLGVARFLLDNGFNVKDVYLDAISPEEEESYNYLKENFGDLFLKATIHPEGRVIERDNRKVLAIGQKAAWFNNTTHFVNVIEGDGCIGYKGLMNLLDMMVEALGEEKDLNDIVPRKAVGLCSNCGIL